MTHLPLETLLGVVVLVAVIVRLLLRARRRALKSFAAIDEVIRVRRRARQRNAQRVHRRGPPG